MRYVKVILFVNLHKKNAQTIAEEIRRELEVRGAELTVYSFDNRPDSFPNGAWDIAFSLGGDGTVLYAARILAAANPVILPIHFGTLGFLASVEQHEWLPVYESWLKGTARVSRRCMLAFSVNRGGMVVYSQTYLNDVVISSAGKAKLIRLSLKTEVSPGECADLGGHRSDGLIVATPTGSTAYSMAAGGPIVDPEMEALIVSPICSFTLSNRPLVIPSRQTLIIMVEKEQRSGIVLTVDGQDTFDLEPNDIITINQSPHFTRLITADRSSYYSALKNKLSWGGGGGASSGGDNA